MIRYLTWIALLLAPLLSATACRADEVRLEYRGRLGEVREYGLALDVRGERKSYGESRPVRIRAQFHLREEVIGVEREGVFWMRVSGQVVDVRDPTGTLASGRYNRWPEMKVRVDPRGRLLAASLAADRPAPGPPQRGFASLMSRIPAVIMPSGPVAVGTSWESDEMGGHQENRLLSLGGAGGRIAHIAGSGQVPLSLREESRGLGVAVDLTGVQNRESELDFLVERGLVLRHRGEMSLATKEEVALELPEGGQRFLLESDLRISFDLRLLKVDGAPVSLESGGTL